MNIVVAVAAVHHVIRQRDRVRFLEIERCAADADVVTRVAAGASDSTVIVKPETCRNCPAAVGSLGRRG